MQCMYVNKLLKQGMGVVKYFHVHIPPAISRLCFHTYMSLYFCCIIQFNCAFYVHTIAVDVRLMVTCRSHSTGSLVSVADSLSSGGGAIDEGNTPKLEEYIEVFLTILIILNVQRRRNPATKPYVQY